MHVSNGMHEAKCECQKTVGLTIKRAIRFFLFGGDGEGYICSEEAVKFWAKEILSMAKKVILLVPKHSSLYSSLLHIN